MAKPKTEAKPEDNQTAENPNDKAEIVVVGEENKDVTKTETDPETRAKELQVKLEAEQIARKASDERAAKAEKDRQEAVSKAVGSENNAVVAKERELESAKTAIATTVSTLEDQYQAALEAGDSKAARETNSKLQKALIRQDRIEEEQGKFSAWKEQQKEIAKRQPVQQGPSPAAQAWIGRNPRFTQDAEFAQEAEAAYALGERRGFAKDSIEHYKFVDSRLKQIYGEKGEDAVVVTEAPKKTVPYSAPPNRGTGAESGNEGSGRKTYKLTPSQVEAAGFMGMTTVEYAQYLEAEKERA